MSFSMSFGAAAGSSSAKEKRGGSRQDPHLATGTRVAPAVKPRTLSLEADDEEDERDAHIGRRQVITGVTEKAILTDEVKKAPLVIPFIEKNRWRQTSPSGGPQQAPAPVPLSVSGASHGGTNGEQVERLPTDGSGTTEKKWGLQIMAKGKTDAAILAASQQAGPPSSDAQAAAAAAGPSLTLEEEATNLLISANHDVFSQAPLLVANRVPGADALTSEEEKLKLDLSLRPEDNDESMYERVPVEDFGKALLLGMGWQEGQRLGKTKNGLLKPIEYVPRQALVGLGADPGAASNLPGGPGGRGKGKGRPDLVAPADANGKVRHVVDIDEKLEEREDLSLRVGAYVYITHGQHKDLYGKIERSETRSSGLLYYVQLDASQSTVKIWPEDLKVVSRQERRQRQIEDARHAGSKRQQRRSRSPVAPAGPPSSSSQQQQRPKEKERSPTRIDPRESWLYTRLYVRFISKKVDHGRWYRKKGVITDVIEPGVCSFRSDDGETLHRVLQRDLETIVPSPPAEARIVGPPKSSQKGQIVQMMQKGVDGKDVALVRFEDDEILQKWSYDDLCAIK